MIPSKPDSTVFRAEITWLDRQLHLAEVLSINARSHIEPWPAEVFHRHLDERYVIGKIAAHEGRVVGYLIYTLYRDHIEVLKMEVDPDCQGRGIVEQMVENLARQLSPAGRKEIFFRIPEADVEMLRILDRCGFKESGIPTARQDADGTLLLRNLVHQVEHGEMAASGGSNWPASETGPASPRRDDGRSSARALPDGLAAVRRRLAELTGVEWDVVKPGRGVGRFRTVQKAADLEGVDPSDIYLRTVSRVANPAAACGALRDSCGIAARRAQAVSIDRPSRVVFPSTWLLRLAHRRPESGPARPLREAFRPVGPPARSGSTAGRRPRREARD